MTRSLVSAVADAEAADIFPAAVRAQSPHVGPSYILPVNSGCFQMGLSFDSVFLCMYTCACLCMTSHLRMLMSG